MKILKTATLVAIDIDNQKHKGKTIGFVPTMGALHDGHQALINTSKSQGHYTICSIFVNPTQFNDPSDLEKYPRTLEKDILLLVKSGADVLYCPDSNDVYGNDYLDEPIDLGQLEHILEGASRPNHFMGVSKVVKRLFEITRCDHAYFGQKDYQQTLVVKKMMEQFGFDIQLHVCPIIRESNGLAMSSRNERLSAQGRKLAGFVYKALSALKEDIKHMPLSSALQKARDFIQSQPNAELEYLEITDGNTLQPLNYTDESRNSVALIVVKYENVRLLDNILL